MKRMRGVLVSVSAVMLALVPAPGRAVDVGAGALTGSWTCANQQAAMQLEGAAFAFDVARPGPIEVWGSGLCQGEQVAAGGWMFAAIEGPGFSCGVDDRGQFDRRFRAGFVKWGPNVFIGLAGTCTVNGVERDEQFIAEGVVRNGDFVGAMARTTPLGS